MNREFRYAIESVQGRRPQNQDAVVAEGLSDDALLLAVADGRGGPGVGEVGSALALQTLSEAIRGGRSLEEAVQRSNATVHERRLISGAVGMASTLTALLLDRERLLLANVGDSRAYRVTQGGIRFLTVDHTVPTPGGEGPRPGGGGASPWEEALTRSIGAAEAVEVDLFGPFPADEDAGIVLCTDGLHKILGPKEIWAICLDAEGPQEAADALVSAAYHRGSTDNVTVALAYLGAFPRVGRREARPTVAEAPPPRGNPPADLPGGPGNPGASSEESRALEPRSVDGEAKGGAETSPLRKPPPPGALPSRGPPVVVGGPRDKGKNKKPRGVRLALLAALLITALTLILLRNQGVLP